MINAGLRREIETAIEAIPEAHRVAPEAGSIVSDPNSAFAHLQDWAFTQGYAFVISSSTDIRARFLCIHHSEKTRNFRKLGEDERQRLWTNVRQQGCKVSFYVSKQKRKGDNWVFGTSQYTIHTHPPAPDPFQLAPHVSRRPGRLEAIRIATAHRGTIGYAASKEILQKQGLKLDTKTFYNLCRKEQTTNLTDQEQARLIFTILQDKGFHIIVDDLYIHGPDGSKQDRIIQAIAWMNAEQIRQGRRFISRRIGQSDATFNTNDKRMLLSSVVGIDNTGSTFTCMHLFHINESARFFRFCEQIWMTYFFYDCPGPAVWCGDFAAGFTAAMAESAALQAVEARRALQKGKEKEAFDDESDDPFAELFSEPPSPALVEDSSTGNIDHLGQLELSMTICNTKMILQHCEWHAVIAIKKKLIQRGYKGVVRDKIMDLIWKWVKADSIDKLNSSRAAILAVLKPSEQSYLLDYYQPKEPSFCRAYTSYYPNLGCHASARVEKAHDVISVGLSKNQPVSRAIEIICERAKALPQDYDDKINKERLSVPRLVDREFFKLCLFKITHFALEKAMVEFVQAKLLLDLLEKEQRDHLFDTERGCQENCQLPLRFGIPCKCWMAYFISLEQPLPLILFDSRWLYDGPEVLHESWEMRLDNPNLDGIIEAPEDRYAGDRFRGYGGEMILNTAVSMAEKHKTLPPEDAEHFALAFKELNERLAARQDALLKSKEAIPARLPDALIPPKLTFIPGRKRALTGAELALMEEADKARRRRKEEREKELQEIAELLMDEDIAERSNTQQESISEYLERLQREEDGGEEDNGDNFNDATINPTVAESSTSIPSRQTLPPSKAIPAWEALRNRKRSPSPPTPDADTSFASNYDPNYVPETQYPDVSLFVSDDDFHSAHEGNIDTNQLARSFSSSLPSYDEFISQTMAIQALELGMPSEPPRLETPPPSRPVRAKKLTSKAESQERHKAEIKQAKEQKQRRKPKMSETPQLMDLPIRSP
jgi:hypothetical protein